MFECTRCGRRFSTQRQLIRHYVLCESGEEKEAGHFEEGTGEFFRPDSPGPELCVTIPFFALPPEARLLKAGSTVALRVLGKLTPEGVLIQSAEFLRS